MRTHRRFLILAALAAVVLSIGFTSCKKDNNNGGDEVPPDGGQLTIDCKDWSKWHYISLEGKGKEVGTSLVEKDAEDKEWVDKNSWDIALHCYQWKTNSGTSGNGKGGAFATDGTDFTALTKIPEGVNFVVDNRADDDAHLAVFDFSKMQQGKGTTTVSLNTEMAKALPFANMQISISERVMLVKGATGKVYKLQATGIKGDNGEKYQITFRFVELR